MEDIDRVTANGFNNPIKDPLSPVYDKGPVSQGSQTIDLDQTVIGGYEKENGEKRVLVEDQKTKKPRFVAPEQIDQDPKRFKLRSMSGRNLIETLMNSYKAGREFSQYSMDRLFMIGEKTWDKVRPKLEKREAQIPVPTYLEKLKEIGLSEKVIGKENMERLLNGKETSLIKTELKKEGIQIKNLPEFTLKVEKDSAGKEVVKLTFKQERLNLDKDNIGKKLSPQEKEMLLATGSLEIQREGEKKYKVSINGKTNTLDKEEVSPSGKEQTLEKGMIPAPKHIVDSLQDHEHEYLRRNQSVIRPNITVDGLKGKYYASISKNEKGEYVIKEDSLVRMPEKGINKKTDKEIGI